MLQAQAKNLVEAVLRQRSLIFGSILVSAVLSMVGYKFVPKNYKIQATISIQSQYFQSPLVRDFVSESWDTGEMRSQREALIKRALNHKYLLELGKRYDLIQPGKNGEISTYELDLLSKRFEITSAGGSSFIFSFFSKDPEQGYRLLQEVIAHLRTFLFDERRNTLLRVHDAIQDQLEVLAFNKQGGTPATIMASRPDLVKVEIERVEAQIAVLKRNYSDKHPKIAELRGKLQSLNRWLKEPSTEIASMPARVGVFSGAKVDDSSLELFQELLKKYHYLEVALYLDTQNQDKYLVMLQEPFVPKAPIWPKRPIFLIWGVLAGLVIGALLALLSETLQARSIRFRKLSAAV